MPWRCQIHTSFPNLLTAPSFYGNKQCPPISLLRKPGIAMAPPSPAPPLVRRIASFSRRKVHSGALHSRCPWSQPHQRLPPAPSMACTRWSGMPPHPGTLCKSWGQNNHRIRPEKPHLGLWDCTAVSQSPLLCPQRLLSSSDLALRLSATVSAVPLLESSSCCSSPRLALITCPPSLRFSLMPHTHITGWPG